MNVSTFPFVPNVEADHHALTVSGAVVQLPALHADTRFVYISADINAEAAEIRMTLNGTDPAAGTGHLLSGGDALLLSRDQAEAAKFIRNAADDGAIQASEHKD